MFLCWFIISVLVNKINSEELKLETKTHSSFLEKYEFYINANVIHLVVPPHTAFASFKFVSSETDYSIFGCNPRNVSLYMKQGSLPVINPDGSKFSENFRNITRNQLRNMEILSNEKPHYFNITNPYPGSYYVAAFLAYTDPRNAAIQQQGLAPNCAASIDVNLYIKRVEIEYIINEIPFTVDRNKKYYKLYTDTYNGALLKLSPQLGINGTLLLEKGHIPSNDSLLFRVENILEIPLEVIPNSWYYLQFNEMNSTTFKIKYLNLGNTIGNHLNQMIPYKGYNLFRDGNTDSFTFTFEIQNSSLKEASYVVNITDKEFTAMKFHINDIVDIGGTIQFSIAFKPRITKTLFSYKIEKEPDNHNVIGCISNGAISIPTWPHHCSSSNIITEAPLLLNNTVDNATINIAYPESGVWYASFKLFCGICKPCQCPKDCDIDFKNCLDNCMISCDNCTNCSTNCKRQIIKLDNCKNCNCDGNCQRTKTECNSSLIFDLTSHSCVNGGCGNNGRCMFMVSDGIVYSSCVCFNNYRGWDCTDDSFANPLWLVVLGLVLLVLSNLAFLPAIIIAYLRQYYVECFVYSCTMLSSMFYHACDAGENIVSVCMFRLGALQFADFFCALFAIWVTLLAIADFSSFWTNILQVIGAVSLAIFTTINKTSLWVFGLPAVIGLLLITINWYMKYRKIKKIFLRKNYLRFNIPIGSVIVVFGLIIYALLQTEDNYKYLHSLWHMTMASAVVILLPKRNTFQPEALI